MKLTKQEILDVDFIVHGLHLQGLSPFERAEFLRMWALRFDVAGGREDRMPELEAAEKAWESQWAST